MLKDDQDKYTLTSHFKCMQLEKRLLIVRCVSNVLESDYVDYYANYLILSHKQFTLLV